MSTIAQTSSAIFDPRVNLETGESRRTQVIWTSQNVKWALDAIEVGKPLKSNPFYDNKPPIRKGNLVFQYSDEEIAEVARCMVDITYFAEKYCVLMTGTGKRDHIKLRDYQRDQLLSFANKDIKKHQLLWSRQASKTTTTAIYMCQQMVTTVDTQIAVLANKLATASEVVTKTKDIFKALPFFLQQGVVGWNGGGFMLDNGSKIFCAPTTYDALNGKTCRIAYIDEFSFVFDGNVEKQKEFLANAQPVLSSFKHHKLIISSTPNGRDLFYELYNGSNSVRGKSAGNGFESTRVPWRMIPGRDEEWAKEMINTIGKEKFEVQYNLSFDAKLDKLLNAQTMMKLDRASTEFEDDAFDDLFVEAYPGTYRFKPGRDIQWKKEFMLFSTDLAEGLKQDYTTLHGFALQHYIDKKRGKVIMWLEQIMVWESNEIDLQTYATILAHTVNMFNQDNVRLLAESNKYGEQLMSYIDVMEDDDLELEVSTWLHYKRSLSAKFATRGLLVNSAIKKLGVSAYKKVLEGNMIDITDKRTIEQIDAFQENKKGGFEASFGHDDLVTPITNLSFGLSLNSVGITELVEDYLEYHRLDNYDWSWKVDVTRLANKYRED